MEFIGDLFYKGVEDIANSFYKGVPRKTLVLKGVKCLEERSFKRYAWRNVVLKSVLRGT